MGIEGGVTRMHGAQYSPGPEVWDTFAERRVGTAGCGREMGERGDREKAALKLKGIGYAGRIGRLEAAGIDA